MDDSFCKLPGIAGSTHYRSLLRRSAQPVTWLVQKNHSS